MSLSPSNRPAAAPRARGLSLLLSLLLIASALPPGARGQETDAAPAEDRATFAAPAGKGAEFVPGEALVRFRSESAADVAEAVGADIVVEDQIGAISRGRLRARVERLGAERIVPGLRLVRVDAGRTLEAIAALNERADVLYAEPNFRRYKMATPNDPNFPGNLYGLTRINAPAAWDVTTGSASIVVGVVDEGIDINHPDLQANVWVNPGDPTVNGVDDDGNGRVDDTNGWDFINNNRTVYDGAPGNNNTDAHGTHVAGTIGAVGNNGVGVVGVNWTVKLMSLKIFNPTSTSTAAQLAAYAYAAAMLQRFQQTGGAQGANVRVLNNSYGGGGFEQSELDAIRALSDAGILFVASAGNESRDNFSFPTFPANYDSPNIIAVASTNQTDALSGFSSFSSRLVSIGAPGSSILSTTPNNTYSFFSGTSMAAPHVTGAAALLLSANPSISVRNLRGALAYTGDPVTSLQNVTTTGRRLNLPNALNAALENDTTAPSAAASLSVASQTGRAVQLSWIAPGDDGAGGGPAADYDFFFVNPQTGLRVLLPSTVQPAAPGSQQSATVNIPFRNFSGSIELRSYDNRGNFSAATVAVSVPVNNGSDPYLVNTSAAGGLSVGGTRLALDGDDRYLMNQNLPFAFPFYGSLRPAVHVSTNGVLYFSQPAFRDNGDADDAFASVAGLQGQSMIAGLWDDIWIDTAQRADSGVFVVQPDANRIIYRWQGITFLSPRQPVNFEIELRSDGTIITRYGTNPRLFPVVGISGGEPSAYVVESHTRELTSNTTQPISLTNAPTVTFAPRPAGPPPAIISFNLSADGASEAQGRATIQLVRTGNTGVAASVSVRTVDNNAAVRCDDTQTLPGVAFARCDYVTTVTSVSFAPGENLKSFAVPLVNDGHVEPMEQVQLALFSPSAGAEIGTTATMQLNLTSDDAPGAPNPINNHQFFVRQQYLDFLSREPDQGGFDAWVGVLTNCPNPFNTNGADPSAECDQNLVSSAFFRSNEFERKGRFVFHFYRLSFNRLPLYAEIIPDMASVTGQTPEELFARKAAFTNAWVTRPEFTAIYGGMTNQTFVDSLMNRYGTLPAITTTDPAAPDTGGQVTFTRADLVNHLNAATLTRAQVVRAIADSTQVGEAEFRRAFVAMQYFGYLRRDPEEPGFTNWLTYLNANPNDFYTMVNGFVHSGEYRLRFGQQ